ncbi:MAG: hypothetical protein AB2A00_27165 [Myxococcota bacterium]
MLAFLPEWDAILFQALGGSLLTLNLRSEEVQAFPVPLATSGFGLMGLTCDAFVLVQRLEGGSEEAPVRTVFLPVRIGPGGVLHAGPPHYVPGEHVQLLGALAGSLILLGSAEPGEAPTVVRFLDVFEGSSVELSVAAAGELVFGLLVVPAHDTLLVGVEQPGGDEPLSVVRAYRLSTRELVASVEGYLLVSTGMGPDAVTVSGDQPVAVQRRDGMVRLWKPWTTEEPVDLGHSTATRPLTLVGDDVVGLAGWDHTEGVTVMRVSTGEATMVQPGYQTRLETVWYSPAWLAPRGTAAIFDEFIAGLDVGHSGVLLRTAAGCEQRLRYVHPVPGAPHVYVGGRDMLVFDVVAQRFGRVSGWNPDVTLPTRVLAPGLPFARAGD